MYPDTVVKVFECNHEEADTRIPMHAALCSEDVVVAKDTDIIVLLAYAYEKCSSVKQWLMKYDKQKYANIGKLCRFRGLVICKYLPQLHAITGCNATYFYRVGKINPLKRVLKSSDCLQLLAGLGKESFDDESQLDAMKFIQTILYCGKDEEDYVSTRVRLYKKQKKKSSLTIPPDPASCKQAIIRVHYQCCYWVQCLRPVIKELPLESHGY